MSKFRSKKIHYLASPYSHPNPAIKQERATQVIKASVDLFKRGFIVFSPIGYNCHWETYDLPGDWSVWEEFDKAFIDRCDSVVVLNIPGWDQSVGVQAEIEHAKLTGKPVIFLTPDQIENNDLDHLI